MIFPAKINLKNLLSWVIVLGVLSASALLGTGKIPLPEQYLWGAIGAGILALLTIWDMRVGLTILVLAAGVVNFSIGTGTKSSINAAMLLVAFLGAIWALRMATSRQVRLAPSPLNRPLLAFLITAVFSWLVGYVVLDPEVTLPGNILVVQAGQYAIFLLTALAFFIMANHAVNERLLQAWVIYLILAGVGILAVRTFTSRYNFLGVWSGALLTWPFALLFAQILFNSAMKGWLKIASLGAFALWGYWVVVKTLSYKSAWAPALGALLLLVLFKSRRLFLLVILFMVVAILVIGPAEIWASLLEGERYSANPVRWSLWIDVFRMGVRSALLGLGPANYIYYWQDLSFESVSYDYVNPYAFARNVYAPPAHNLYADLFAQTGALGLFFFTWAIGAGLWLGVQVLKRPLTPFQRAYAYAVLAGFTSLSVASFVFAEWLMPYVYNLGLAGFRASVYSWLLLGALVGLGREAPPQVEPAA